MPLQIGLLPVVLPGLVAVGEREDGEVHRAHIERAHFRLGDKRRREPLLDRHAEPAARRHIDDRIRGLFDTRQKLHEHGGIGSRASVLRIAGMQMKDRGARFRRRDRLRRDVVGCVGQRVGHRRRMDAAGDSAGNDDLVACLRLGHDFIFLSGKAL